MANHFAMTQVELERMGYAWVSTNTSGGETWQHGVGHSIVIRPNMAEHAHRDVLRKCRKALGIKVQANKRKVDQIKDRQQKQREMDKREAEARLAWLEARIRDLEMAASMRQLTSKQQQLLNDRLREHQELNRLMSQTPGWA